MTRRELLSALVASPLLKWLPLRRTRVRTPPPVTKFAVIYSQATGRVRWYLKPDQDSELNQLKPGTGEAIQIIPMEQYGNHVDVQTALNRITGLNPANDRYAIVDVLNNVVGITIADPLCGDAPPSGSTWLPHATADVGWSKLIDGTLADLRVYVPVIKLPN